MKIKKILIAFTVLGMVLTGCNKDDNAGDPTVLDPEGESGMFIKFTQGVNSKADANEVADQTVVTFESGKLLFTDVHDVVLHEYDIVPLATGGTSVTISQLKQGVLFPNIKNTAVKTHIVGNHSFGKATYEGLDIAELFSETTDLNAQKDPDYGVKNATLFGEGNIEPASAAVVAATGADREAIFEVWPLIARLEMKKITALQTNAGSDPTAKVIESYKLAGLYINNFYYELNVDGRYSTLNEFYNFLSEAPDYASETKGGKYLDGSTTVDWTAILFDEIGKANNSNLSVVPTNEVWAYNVFANTTAVPHIVLHFEDVMIYDDPMNITTSSTSPYTNTKLNTTGVAYLTVVRYFSEGNTVGVYDNEEDIHGGKIYRISDLKFTGDDLDDVPEEKTPKEDEFGVYVEVKLMPWEVIEVEGGF